MSTAAADWLRLRSHPAVWTPGMAPLPAPPHGQTCSWAETARLGLGSNTSRADLNGTTMCLPRNDLVASTLKLLILIPVLYVLSLELSLLVTLVIPPYLYAQLRSGRVIVRAAQVVRASETRFMRFIEENVVFASTRKTFGLGRSFDARLAHLQETVVDKFDRYV